ncbi:hypothetical protein SB766_28395, partial [Pseudomonas sp. SIMBA_077]
MGEKILINNCIKDLDLIAIFAIDSSPGRTSSFAGFGLLADRSRSSSLTSPCEFELGAEIVAVMSISHTQSVASLA